MSSFCPTFKPFLKLVYVKNVEQTVCFISFDHHCLLIEAFESFTFSVITDRVKFKYVILLFLFYLLHLYFPYFLLLFSIGPFDFFLGF